MAGVFMAPAFFRSPSRGRAGWAPVARPCFPGLGLALAMPPVCPARSATPPRRPRYPSAGRAGARSRGGTVLSPWPRPPFRRTRPPHRAAHAMQRDATPSAPYASSRPRRTGRQIRRRPSMGRKAVEDLRGVMARGAVAAPMAATSQAGQPGLLPTERHGPRPRPATGDASAKAGPAVEGNRATARPANRHPSPPSGMSPRRMGPGRGDATDEEGQRP